VLRWLVILALLATPLAVQAGSSLTPRYPVVMVPGFMGFRSLSLGPLNIGNYFRGVEKRLRERGVTVRTAYVGLTNSVADRAAKLKSEIDRHFPTGKVNLIAHSTGGLDAREMIARLGMAGRVASLTTIATPHQGTPVADAVQFAVGPGTALSRLLNWMGIPHGAFHDLTTASCRAFNARTPDAPGVRYFSLGGHQHWVKMPPPLMPFSWLLRLRDRVAAGNELGVTARVMLRAEPWGDAVLEYLRHEELRVRAMGATAHDRARWEAFSGKNDGMVPLWSTPHGESFEQIPMDHWDQIGWITFKDTRGFYERVIEQLALRGL
jgi:triacylglycerol esterase/lipase EstA (alpha/beta hydrolase family)